MLEPLDPLQFLLGAGLFLLPGFVWVWALAPTIPLLARIPLALVAAFTVEPGTLFTLHLLFSLPLSLGVHVFLSAALSVLGLGTMAIRAARRYWDELDPLSTA